MPCTNRDASLLTQKRRGMAEYSYYVDWKKNTVNNATGFANQALKGPCVTGAETHLEIGLGGSAAYEINNEAVKLGNSSASAQLYLPTVYDGNTARYPANSSRGGASSATATS